jgi:N-methylhydantoinase B/oxoprolinase/acetone carboxylase alpha subunit
MEEDITTMKDAEREIQALIDRFTNDIFIEACEEMASAADIAKQAREEEQASSS